MVRALPVPHVIVFVTLPYLRVNTFIVCMHRPSAATTSSCCDPHTGRKNPTAPTGPLSRCAWTILHQFSQMALSRQPPHPVRYRAQKNLGVYCTVGVAGGLATIAPDPGAQQNRCRSRSYLRRSREGGGRLPGIYRRPASPKYKVEELDQKLTRSTKTCLGC